jgi:hypothetical protein
MKINNKDLQKIVKNYNTTKHTTTQQVPNVIYNNDNPTAIKNARSKIKAQAVKLLAENNRKFRDMVRVAKRTIGEWKKAYYIQEIQLYEDLAIQALQSRRDNVPNKDKSIVV